MKKIPVAVLAQYGTAGDVHPISITWPDGRIYPIDSILDLRTARTSAGRFRYTVTIHGQSAYLYRTGDKWFMDGAE